MPYAEPLSEKSPGRSKVPDELTESEMDKLLDQIYENARSNAMRYWHRIWLVNKFFHDKELIDRMNESQRDLAHAFVNMRESVLDSAVISLGRGFLDQGDDCLSLTRLMPSTSHHLTSKRKEYRLNEEEEACDLLYKRWYEGHETDGAFISNWYALSAKLESFRDSQDVKDALTLRNTMVVHSLEDRPSMQAEFRVLYRIRDELVGIMNVTTALFEHRATEWGGYLSQSESSAIAFRRALLVGAAA